MKLIEILSQILSTEVGSIDSELLNKEIMGEKSMGLLAYENLLYGVKDRKNSYGVSEIFGLLEGSLYQMKVDINNESYRLGEIEKNEDEIYIKAEKSSGETERFKILLEEERSEFKYKSQTLLTHKSRKGNHILSEVLRYGNKGVHLKIVGKPGKGLKYLLPENEEVSSKESRLIKKTYNF